MTKKEKELIKNFLNKPSRIKKILEILEREYNEKLKEAGEVKVNYSEIKVNSVSSAVENKAIELSKLKDRINECILELNTIKAETEEFINKIDDTRLINILRLRYLDFREFKYIARISGYSTQHTYYLHSQAFEKILNFINKSL